MTDENTPESNAVFGAQGGQAQAPEPTRTPEEQKAWDEEDARLCAKHGCNPGWGHHYERESKRQAPPVGSTVDPQG